ncbi:DNA-binding Lrp family transcriptional regulator [Actinokineospora baliensis]|uniref:Lrp/AsnC family transcriptional regulator n=1 Tax=Actinokineospora baliensis TaxID=547056 RepID=UPI00195C734E|nr:Lrp/AsnC family transcriptional regulator [Actinokineospora baliensis]MBM7773799.1 DNA-binding Lrp family transcriptional regulator [Actinokineospora baliensis]
MATELSELDQQVASALQVDGRAGPGRIAGVLGVSGRTVARSLARMGSSVRVVRVPDRARLPEVTLLRVRVLRGRVEVLADALARRPEVLFVDVITGGEEISAVTVGGAPALPTGQAVTSVRAHAVLHVFSDAADWRTRLLTADEVAALTPPPPAETHTPDALDEKLIELLTADARTGPGPLAAAVRAPESTVRRRLDRLADSGLLRTCVVADPRLFGLAVDANVWMAVPPDRLPEFGERLAADPLVHGVLATTGATNLMAAVFCRDLAQLYGFVTRLTDIPSAEVTVVGGAVKRAGHRF